MYGKICLLTTCTFSFEASLLPNCKVRLFALSYFRQMQILMSSEAEHESSM